MKINNKTDINTVYNSFLKELSSATKEKEKSYQRAAEHKKEIEKRISTLPPAPVEIILGDNDRKATRYIRKPTLIMKIMRLLRRYWARGKTLFRQ